MAIDLYAVGAVAFLIRRFRKLCTILYCIYILFLIRLLLKYTNGDNIKGH